MGNKTLIFEGAGWEDADISIESGVGNCRIRTRIRNKDGRLIYLEMSGIKHTGKIIPKHSKGFNITGMIDHIFYADAKWDSRSNFSKDLQFNNINFEYNKENILKFVNENLNCDFKDVKVTNYGLRVHDTKEALCDCSVEGYKPFKEIKISINELKDVKPLIKYERHNQVNYRVPCNELKDLLKNIIKNYDDYEVKKQLKENAVIIFRYDENNIIWDCEISCGFGVIGMYVEDLKEIVSIIKHTNNIKVA